MKIDYNSDLPILLIGNGAIALEFIYAIYQMRSSGKKIKIIWVLKESYVGHAWLDRAASAFLLPRLFPEGDPLLNFVPVQALHDSKIDSNNNEKVKVGLGGSLGPFWYQLLHCDTPVLSLVNHTPNVLPFKSEIAASSHSVTCNLDSDWLTIETCTAVQSVHNLASSSIVRLENQRLYEVQFVLAATGVAPNTNFCADLKLDDQGGILVNDKMNTSFPDIFAAGDCCSINLKCDHWFQMRLWSQARLQGIYSAHCMLNSNVFHPFDLFSHVTFFFGMRVVLLGRY